MMNCPDIKIVDCTIRDGGLANNFNFDDKFVKAVYTACVDAGVDYMEIGYKASKKAFSRLDHGKWKFSDEDDIKKIVESKDTRLKLSVMVDTGRTDYHEDILPKSRSVIDMVRVAFYSHQLSEAVDIVKDAHDKGYETAANLMASSLLNESELDKVLNTLATTEVNVIYLVDSYGAYYPETIKDLTKKYLKYGQQTGKAVGIHAHNNQQLAFANTIKALHAGAEYLDVTISGLGRGAGNCPLELLIGFLKNPKYNVLPILHCSQEYVDPLRKEVRCGFDTSYMLTGQFNMHPQLAIDFLNGEDTTNYLAFYDSICRAEKNIEK